ncbi:hypothetical protein FRC02_001004 [Tulasnella sp. 418]|nr:hypothetical protein FRC02_001004 [Tulasnella sp. 418]
MSSSQRRFQNAESRISRRANNSSPYKSSKLPPAQVKTTSTFASLFSFLPNPFKRRTGPPQSLPQIEHSQQNSSRSDEESTDDEEPVERMETGDRLIRADDSMDDSMIVEDALNQSTYSVISTMTKRGEAIQREQQERQEQSNVPFPRLTDNTNTFSSSPSTSAFSTSPSKRRTAIPPPPLANHAQFRLSELGSPPKTHPAFGQPTSPTHNDQVKGIAEFIEARARSGHGNAQLTQDEIQQLNNLVSSTALDDPSLPSAALFGRGFVPSASKSFLAPPQQPQYSVPTFSIGTSSQSQRTLNRSSARRRPVYVGPGMGSNKRANGMMMNTSRSSILSPMPRSTTYGGLSTIKDDEGTGDGKRRRMDAAYGQQQGVASSASVPYSFNFGQSQMSGSQNTGLNVNGPNYERTTISPQPPSQLGINGVTSGSKSTAPNGMPSSASNGLLRPPLPSLNPPVKPSPLRNMTKATDSPSPPRSLTNQTASPPTVPQSISTAVPKPKSQSKTSTVVLGILNDVDKELSGNNKNKEIDEAVRNPYERVGVKVPVSMATTKKRNVSGSRRKPVEKKRDEDDVPDSVKGIEAALPSVCIRG